VKKPENYAKIFLLDYLNLKKKGDVMFNYKAYEIGHKKSYPVTQIRWDGDEKHIAFNGMWHKESECILCAGTGVKNSDGDEIFENDILQLGIYDDSCCCKGKIGIVTFNEGKFSWSTLGGWSKYSLSGKSCKYLGNISFVNDITKFYTTEQMKHDGTIIRMFKKLFNCSYGVIFEKHKQIIITEPEPPYIDVIAYRARKQEKTLLHQYRNYLKIKGMIESKEIYPEIMDSNLKTINCKK
jgi:hypothetical protein